MQQRIHQLEFDLRKVKLNAQWEKEAVIEAFKDRVKGLQNELVSLRQQLKENGISNSPVRKELYDCEDRPELNDFQKVRTSGALDIRTEGPKERTKEQHTNIQHCFWSCSNSVNPNHIILTYVE
mmetsp:Transcript_27013/g.40882  ORF Transcript_27013/g.40882 Transcript_27013/m.40882 type:complete len:124 (+) Transcript_27013:534-905(+)